MSDEAALMCDRSALTAAPMRVCRVVTQASATGLYGGPYDTARRQARLAATFGADVVLVAGHLAHDAPTEEVVANLTYALSGVRQLVGHRPAALASLGIVRSLWTQIGRADVVHVSFAREAVPLIAAALCVVRRKRWIAQPHGMMTSRTSAFHRAVDCAVLPLLRRADVIVVLTDQERVEVQRLGKLGSSRFVALGNPLPERLSAFESQTSRLERRVVFVARLHPRKRVHDFIAAAQIAASRSWPETYRVVGPDGGDLAQVQQAERDLTNLEYGGAVSSDGVLHELSRASVFVLCSEREPWGNVLISALALGVPVVVTESAALAPEVMRINAGIVVPDGHPEAIADAVHKIIGDTSLAETMAENAQRHANALLSNQSQMVAIEQIYETALGI